jgi:membrane fusion protein (multidrug efflux system)
MSARSRLARSVIVGCVVALSAVAAACGRTEPAVSGKPAAPGPPTIAVVRVVERAVDVTLPLPGELDPYETVAMYPKVTGFLKAIHVDRGSRVRSGDLIAEIEAPEVVAQRAESESKLLVAQAQVAAARAKAEADASTAERLKAASATPGVVAGNDLVVAQKAVEADQDQVVAAQQTVEAARQALQSLARME